MQHTKAQLRAVFSAIVILILFSVTLVLSGASAERTEKKATDEKQTVKTVSDEKTTLVPGEEYIIIFSSDSNLVDADIATALRSQLNKSSQRVDMRSDTQQKERTFEILIGNTNRALSAELKAACQSQVVNNSLVWGFAFRDGKFAYAAATDEAFARGKNEVIERFVTEEFTFEVPSDLWLIVSLSRADYEAELEAEKEYQEWLKEQERLKRIEELKTEIGAFDLSDFTDRSEVTLEYAVMENSGTWGKPVLSPTVGQHPRLNITSYALKEVKAYLKTEEGQLLYNKLFELASKDYDGILDPACEQSEGRIGFHNMDEEGLAIIEARAYLYLLTGDEEWGYRAILTMKNYFKTIGIGWIHSDQCREFGRIIFCGAEVYDWCYDLLTEDDKNQFMIAFTDIVSGTAAGTEYEGKCSSGNAYMEVGYPPSLQGSVSGHGSEHQILRDYLAVAVAIFDENPSWYNYVGARVYNDYIVTRNYYNNSGTYQQGIFNYGPYRHNADLWSALILECATGENPYSAMLERITLSFFEQQLPDGSFFGTGDGTRPLSNTTRMVQDLIFVMGLYGNTVSRTIVVDYFQVEKNGEPLLFARYPGTSVQQSLPILISMNASYYKKTGILDGTPVNQGDSPVAYHSYPVGQMIARSEWNNESAPAVFMKIGERTTANHEHADAGSFQIFYKGLYSGESGVYDKYGSTHFTYYHQATVAHNALLVFNPDAAEYEVSGGSVDSITNAEKVFYSGGQRGRISESKTLEGWLNDNQFTTGEVTGHEYGLNDDGTTEYAYLAGDISAAYEPTQVSYVGRRMFTLFTGDETYPMLFIVYDQITATKDTFVKKFLLHTPTEPTVDTENKTVTVTDKDGRLVLKSLKGGDTFEAIGGENRNYLINGVQCATSSTGSDNMWGRVEISNTGAAESDFLSFMYVTDADNDEMLAPAYFESENHIGIQIDSSVIVFAKSTDEGNCDILSFETSGIGLNKYYITGMYPGTWHISVDGVMVAHSVASEDGGMLSFYAPSGHVEVAPGSNIAPSNGGRIIYNSFGGIVPDDAPQVYEIGVPVDLPLNISRGHDTFLGWYTSPTFEEETKVTQLIGDKKGKINLYAAYKTVAVYEDYEDRDFRHSESSNTYGDLTYNGRGKALSVFETVKDEATANTYLRVVRGSADPFIDAAEDIASYIGTDTALTYQIDLAIDGENPAMKSTFYLRENATNTRLSLFSITEAGNVMFGGTTLFKLTESFQRIIITVDFKAGTLTAYNLFGDELGQKSFSVSANTTSGATTTEEWLHYFKYTFNWYFGKGGEADSILIDNIKVTCGGYDADDISIPEGQARIIYNTNGGTLPDGYPLVFTAGKPTELPKPTIDNGTFLGWYTSPDFLSGTEISVIDTDVAEPIEIYAKYFVTIFAQDFEDEAVNADDTSIITIGGIQYQLKDKTGSTAKSVTDEKGNTYIRVESTDADPALNNHTALGSMLAAGGGKITFTLKLGTLENGKVGVSRFRIRNSSSSDTLIVFATNAKGEVLLNGDSTKIITTLTTELQEIIITVDANAATLTAYTSSGREITSKAVSAPTASTITDFAKWLDACPQLFNWYVTKNSGFIVDDINVYTGAYVLPEEEQPENIVKINYQTSGGLFAEEPEKYVSNLEDFTLPTDITNGNYSFCGWYTSPNFEAGTEITAVQKGTSEITVYARWIYNVAMDDFTGKNFSVTSVDENGTGASDYFTFNTNGKTDAYAKTVTDENGNTYVEFASSSVGDPAINSKGISLGDAADLREGKVTFTVDLALVEGKACVKSAFRLRGKDSKDCVSVFGTSAEGYVSFSGTEGSVRIATLGTEFTRIAVTVDIFEATMTAYSLYGEEIATVNIGIPSSTASNYESFAQWFDAIVIPVNWQSFKGDGAFKVDNLCVYFGDYIPEKSPVSE